MKYLVASLFVLVLASACGGNRPGPFDASRQELDQKHCTANADCSSGFCHDGRCG